MAKKVPLDRLRQISKTRRPYSLDPLVPRQQENAAVRNIRRELEEFPED